MKTFICYFLIALTLVQATASAAESDFHTWVKDRTHYLDTRGKVVHTHYGPIQYVWRGDRKKPVVMCLQGAFGGWDQSLLMGENLLSQGFSVLAISRPGYLGSTFTSTGVISNEDQARAMIEVLDKLHLKKVSVMGFSAGAPVAFQVANLFPHRVKSLVLESIGAQQNDVLFYVLLAAFLSYEELTGDVSTLDFGTYMLRFTTRDDFYSTAQKILSLENNLPKKDLKRRIEYVTHHKSQSQFLRKFIHSTEPLSPRIDGVKNDVLLAAAGNWPMNPAFYQNLKTPTIMVQGIHDTNGNLATAKYVHSQIHGSKLILVHGCGHFIWLGVHTNAWEAKVTRFLRKYN